LHKPKRLEEAIEAWATYCGSSLTGNVYGRWCNRENSRPNPIDGTLKRAKKRKLTEFFLSSLLKLKRKEGSGWDEYHPPHGGEK